MKTLGEIISLRQNKYNEDRKNPSFSEFFQGRFDGWYSAYRDLKEILEQNGFNLDVPVIDVVKTNADHIRSMTDEELADYMSEHSIDDFCYIICGGECKAVATSNKTPYQRCREIVSDWLKQPYGGDT